MGLDDVNKYSQYLGEVSSNCFAADSIVNDFGTYGSPYSRTSIRNGFGPWGNPFSSRSATNTFASNPPIIVSKTDGRDIAFLTENEFKNPAVDTSDLIGYLKGVGGC